MSGPRWAALVVAAVLRRARYRRPGSPWCRRRGRGAHRRATPHGRISNSAARTGRGASGCCRPPGSSRQTPRSGQWFVSTSLTVSMLRRGDGQRRERQRQRTIIRGRGTHRRAAPRRWADRVRAPQRQADGRGASGCCRGRGSSPRSPSWGDWRFTTPLTVRAQEADAPAGTAAPALVPIESRGRGRQGDSVEREPDSGHGLLHRQLPMTAAHVVPGESERATDQRRDGLHRDRGGRARRCRSRRAHRGHQLGRDTRSGAEALVLGYGAGQRTLTAGITRGIVSERYAENWLTFIRTDASGGGPLLNLCGD